MYHTLQFLRDRVLDLCTSPKQPLERLRVQAGGRMVAQVKPYVLDTPSGPVEVADRFFADGTSAARVRFEWFTFVDATDAGATGTPLGGC